MQADGLGPARWPASGPGDIMALLEQFSRYGAAPGRGITRLLYDENWLAFQKFIIGCMRQAGMDAAFDAVGNAVGCVKGTRYSGRPVATGSHADTVRCAGGLDGQYGIAAGILAVKRLVEKHGPPAHGLEVVSFAEEEGSRFAYTFWGSKSYTGKADIRDAEELTDDDGVLFTDAMRTAGFDPDAAGESVRPAPHAFVELHVEQGNTLEHSGARLGIVSGIVAQNRFTVRLKGRTNTPAPPLWPIGRML